MASTLTPPSSRNSAGSLPRWWDPQGEFRPLHEINPLRLGWIEGHGRSPARSCWMSVRRRYPHRGHGARGARVTGIDLSEKALRVAELHLLEGKLDIRYEKSSSKTTAARSTS
jgi:2-polyprenyl-6-hydroxyphenyl methylase/3-demethylubiquinone-9 3-methyltransferase